MVKFIDLQLQNSDIEEISNFINSYLQRSSEEVGNMDEIDLMICLKQYRDRLSRINVSYRLPVKGAIVASGRFIKIKIFVKKCIRKLIGWYVADIMENQQYFNALTVQTVNEEYKLLKQLCDNEIVKLKKNVSERKCEDIKREKFDKWYVAFEDVFRGSTEYIKNRNRRYLDYFKDKKNILDLGCGRGELISLFIENGIDARGIDLNTEMVAECKKKDLKVECKDCIKALNDEKDGSLEGIFAGQLVEHLKFETLFLMIELVYKKLNKNGVLIIETVNPLSLAVFSNGFYIDPTHSVPIHPAMLRFLAESIGFCVDPIQFVDYFPDKYLFKSDSSYSKADVEIVDNLNAALYSAQDYYIVCRKCR